MATAGHFISPDTKTFYFPPPLDRAIENVLTLTSSSDKIITYKLKTSAPNSYAVKKRTGFIAPKASESVHITFRGTDEPQTRETKHRFQLEVRYLAEDGSEEAAYNAIGTAPGSPGHGDLAPAIAALNAVGGSKKQLEPTANASDILGFMWKLKTVEDKDKDIVLFNCLFTELPKNMSERRRKDEPKSDATGTRPPAESGGIQSQAPTSYGSAPSEVQSTESLLKQLKQKTEENRKLLQSNEELKRSARPANPQGLPLWLAALIALLSVAAGYLLAPSPESAQPVAVES